MVVLHMIREYFNKKVPCPILFTEESHFEEVYDFIEKIKKDWDLNLIVAEDKKSLQEYHNTNNLEHKKELARILKINALKQAIEKYQWKILFTGIRWDEHKARSKENYFSDRKNPFHIKK